MGEIVRSIREKLFVLPDYVRVYTGHGMMTNIKDEKMLKYTTYNSGISGDNLLSLSVDEEFAWLGIYG